MALPVPQPGQVIRYAYLWWNEARIGREDGTKDRPCGIVLTRVTKAGNRGGPTNLDKNRGRDKWNSAGYAAAASG